jgi:3-hydroxyacyl-CoA dehydrogenase/enoyl-CoA hydratase/carnithine racemase
MSVALSLTWPYDDVALLSLSISNRTTNILTDVVLHELALHLETLAQRFDVAGLIIRSSKPRSFAVGVSAQELSSRLSASRKEVLNRCRRGQQFFLQLSRMPFVTVAAIEGECLGAGAELAAWCDRRIFSDSSCTKFGFPDVEIGLIPGWGGTVRAPRIVGLRTAVEMICTGKVLDPHAAVRMGWGSSVVPCNQLLDVAIQLVLEERDTRSYIAEGQRLSQPLPAEPTVWEVPRLANSEQFPPHTAAHYPAPGAALALIQRTSTSTVEDALAHEAEAFANLFGSPVNAALINAYDLAERKRRESRTLETPEISRGLKSVGIIGAGIMGAGIATAAIEVELSVTLVDADSDALARAKRQIIEEVARDPAREGLDANRVAKFAPLLIACGDVDNLKADLILEAIVESATVKRKLFAEIEAKISSHTILASNTSTIPITSLAKELAHPNRFCGIHFFNPVRRARLVEVIRGAKTTDETVAMAVEFVNRIGRIPLVVNDGPGFLVNRLLYPYLNEAIELMLDGASLEEIDQAAMAFGMPIGPVAVYDLIGIDTAFYAGRNFWMSFPERVNFSPLLPALVKAGRLGQKSGRGFYCYENENREAEDDPSIVPFIERYRRESRAVTADEITRRLLLVMLLEATRLLDGNIAQDVRDIDLGLVFGAAFPPFRGGLLFWADAVGLPTILQWLRPLEKLGPRMMPTERLLRMDRNNEKFYA